MNHKANISRAPLNVLGCQCPGADVPIFPKSASTYLMGAKAASESHLLGAESTSFQEAMDLKLENDRRLHELREQGQQCLLNSGHENLIPVKHGEEEYFPGTRQQKKTRRPKNVRSKCESIKFEEVPPSPMDKILPAGYVPTVNAWSVRKGSELFESRKLSLTLYGPEDEDTLVQRALQESLVTLRQEQDRIVNMYSPYRDDLGQTLAATEFSKEEAKACNGVNAFDKGGTGDGNWMKNENLSSRSGNDTKIFKTPESQDIGKKRYLEAGDSFCGNNGNRQNHLNGREKNSNRNKYSYNRTQSDENVEENLKRSYAQELKLESLGFNKSRAAPFARRETSRKREDRRSSERFEKQQLQEPLVSSGGNQSRCFSAKVRDRHIKFADPLVQNRQNGRCETEVNESDEDPWLEPEEKTDTPLDSIQVVSLITHIQPYGSGCEKHLSPEPDGSCAEPIKDSKTEVTKPPLRSPDPKEGTLKEKPLETTNEEIVRKDPNKTCSLMEPIKTSILPIKSSISTATASSTEKPLETTNEEIVRKDPIKTCSSMELIKTSSLPTKSSISTATASSTGHLEISSTFEVSNLGDAQEKDDQMKQMLEELKFLDSRLKQLSSALQQSHLEGSDAQADPATNTEPLISRESQQASAPQTPPTESQVPPTKTTVLKEAGSADVHPSSMWFQPFPNSMPHLLCPQGLPSPSLVHPFASPVDLPVGPQPDSPLAPGQAHVLRPRAHLQGHSQLGPEENTQILSQGHPLAQGQNLAQAFAFPTPLQLYPQVPPGHPPPRPLAGLQPHLQTQPQTQDGGHTSHPSTYPEALLGHLQNTQQAPVANEKPEQVIPVAQVVAEQQYMAMQGAAAAAAAARSAVYPPGCAPNTVPLVWLGPRPPLPPGSWLSQMKLPPGLATGGTLATSTGDSNSTKDTPNHAATASDAKAGCEAVENADVGNPEGREIPAAHGGPAQANPLSAVNSLPGNKITMIPNSAIQNCASASTNAAPASEVPAHFQWFEQLRALQQQQQHQLQQQLQQQFQALGAGVQNPACSPPPTSAVPSEAGGRVPVEWLSHMKALQQQQQQQQQQMMHLVRLVPGMHPSLPMQRLASPLVPTAAGVPGLGWPVGPPPGKIPPEYQGDWIISPADESRLAQGLPLVPSENHNNLYPRRTNAPGPAQFSDAPQNPTGSGHVLGLAESGSLKLAHPPVPLTGLKQPTMKPQVAISAENSFHNTCQIPTQLAEPPGMETRGKVQPAEPRGRGRLR